jgi:hypothetical protein
MSFRRGLLRFAVAATAVAAFACTDTPAPSGPSRDLSPSFDRSAVAQDRLAALFPGTSRDILAIPGTVFADHDEAIGKLVFGVEDAHAIPGIERSLIARGLSADEFEVRVTAPIVRLSTLQDATRPIQAGTQINFPGYLCTLGFNADYAGAASFVTASHCTNTQGGVESTPYGQPLLSGGTVATEVADPVYVAGGTCSAGRVCRSSDASRALYNGSAESSRGIIAKTTGVNTGSLTIAGFFTVTAQDNTSTTFTGAIHKVGRTTGWTQGNASSTCVTVNVSGSNVQLKCQTLVVNNGAAIVSGGDSGSGVFKITTGDNVTLIGILWGGSGTSTFVFSPLKNVQDELGALVATADGSGGGGGGTPPPPPPPPPCTYRGNSGKCK